MKGTEEGEESGETGPKVNTTKAPVEIDRGLRSRADDQVRTGDLNLGKVALYQLSYVRIAATRLSPVERALLYPIHWSG